MAIIIEEAPPDLGDRAVDWAPDGCSLTFSVTQKGASEVWTQPVAGGPPKELKRFETGSSRIVSLARSSDGRQLAVVQATTTSDAVLISNFIGGEK